MAEILTPFETLFDNIREASFDGASFLVRSHTVTGGRKNVIHEFVNSGRQVVEDLGYKKRMYDIDAIITGDNYENDKRRLLSKLESKKSGVLIHPFFGTIENIKPISYTLTENFSEFGVAVFKIKFSIDDKISVPTKAKNSITEIQSKRDNAVALAKQNFKDGFSVSAERAGVIESAIEKTDQFFDSIQSAVQSVTKTPTERINSLNYAINNFKGRTAELVQDVDQLANAIDELFYNMSTAFDTSLQNFDSYKELFGFGDDDEPQLEINTVAIQNTNDNNNLFNSVVNSYALSFAYVSFALVDTDSSTIDEVEFQEGILEAQYDSTFENSSLDLTALNALTEVRSIFDTVIKEIKTTLPDIEQVEVIEDIPLRALEFQYYGNNDRTELLKSINDDPDVSFYSGNVNLLNDNTES